MPVAGSTFRDLRFAFERRDYREVLATGEHTIAVLQDDPRQREFVAGAMVLVGGALLSVEHYRDAITWLEQGLVRMRDTASEHELRGAHWFHRALADTYLLVGRWDEAAAYLDWLALPEQPDDSRLAATRGQLFLAASFGRFDQAAHLVNAAADLARRARSEIAEAVVEADRALVLAAQGRLREAVHFADGVTPRLAAPAADDRQQWANQQATVLLTTLARLLAETGDLMTAQRYVLEAAVPVAQARRMYATAQYELARSVLWREEGELGRAAPPIRAAIDQFVALDTLPAVAMARLAEAKLAEASGHEVAARSLYERALAEFQGLGLPREQAEARRRLAQLGPPPTGFARS
jgi:ATP/maltotriose-dependent transcriptional regulator MalT